MRSLLNLGSSLQPLSPVAIEPGPANLLLWSEEIVPGGSSPWSNLVGSVAASPDDAASPIGSITAERLEFIAGAIVGQDTGISVSGTSSYSSTANIDFEWQRFHVTGQYDWINYCFSVYLRDDGSAYNLFVGMRVVSGKIFCSIRDVGDEAVVWAWGAQLERGRTTPGVYVKTEG